VTSKRATTYADLKAKNDERLTDHEKALAIKVAKEFADGEHEDMVDRAMPDFLKGRHGSACAEACVSGRRVGSIMFGERVGCCFCGGCRAIMAALYARKKKDEDGSK